MHCGYHKAPRLQCRSSLLIPGFGLLANLVCMAFYLISPVFGLGTFKEPLLALGISAVWGIYGAIYFISLLEAKGKSILLETDSPLPTAFRPQPWVAPFSISLPRPGREPPWLRSAPSAASRAPNLHCMTPLSPTPPGYGRGAQSRF